MKYRVLAALAILTLVVSSLALAGKAFAQDSEPGKICYSRALDAWVEKPKTSYHPNDLYRTTSRGVEQERHIRVWRGWRCLEDVWYPSVERLDTGWRRS